MIVSPEAAQDIRVALDGAAMLGAPVAEALERDLDAALEGLALSEPGGGAAIARRRVGASIWAVLYVVELRRVVVVALVRSRSRST